MQFAQSRRFDFFTEQIQHFGARFDPAHLSNETVGGIDRKIKFAFQTPVVGVTEIFFNDHIPDFGDILFGIVPAVEHFGVEHIASAGVTVVPVMICPHQGEFEVTALNRRKKSLIQSTLQIWSIVPVPVKNKCVDTVCFGSVDLLCHNCGVGFIFITPDGDFRLLMPRKTGTGTLHKLPFCPVSAVNFFIFNIGMIIRKIIRCNIHLYTPKLFTE